MPFSATQTAQTYHSAVNYTENYSISFVQAF